MGTAPLPCSVKRNKAKHFSIPCRYPRASPWNSAIILEEKGSRAKIEKIENIVKTAFETGLLGFARLLVESQMISYAFFGAGHFQKGRRRSVGAVVLIDGTGTIGLPIAKFLLDKGVRDSFGISEVVVRKYRPSEQSMGMLCRLHHAGAKIVVEEKKYKQFVELLSLAPQAFKPDYTYEEALEIAKIVIDCTKDDEGLKNKEKVYRHHEENALTFIAQGSETDFGLPYAYGHNDEVLERHGGKYIWVMSCNVHQLLAIFKVLFIDYEGLENMIMARFDLERRGADVVNEKTINTRELGEPTHPYYGTHQAEDVMKLMQTIGVENLDVHSIANKDPQPFMHTIGARFWVKKQIPEEEITRRFMTHPLTGVTNHRFIGGIYTEGCNWGPTGRIVVQSILARKTVETPRPNEIAFSCVTPQDGNPLLSSIAAMAARLDPKHWRKKIKKHFYPALDSFRVV